MHHGEYLSMPGLEGPYAGVSSVPTANHEFGERAKPKKRAQRRSFRSVDSDARIIEGLSTRKSPLEVVLGSGGT